MDELFQAIIFTTFTILATAAALHMSSYGEDDAAPTWEQFIEELYADIEQLDRDCE